MIRLFLLTFVLIFSPLANAETPKRPVLKVGYPDFDYAPLSLKNNQNQITGMLPALVSAIAKNANYDVINVSYKTFPELIHALKRGDIDVIGGLSASYDRQKYMAFSTPILVIPQAVITDDPALTKVSDLYNKNISVKNNCMLSSNIERIPNARSILMPSSKQAINAVESNIADAFLGNAIYLSNLHNLISDPNNLNILILNELPRDRIYLAANKSKQSLIEQLNKAYSSLSPDIINNIYDSWLTNSQKSLIEKPYRITFSQNELQWLKNKKTLNIGYQFHKKSDQKFKNSLSIQLLEILDLIKPKLNVDINFVPIENYQDALNKLNNKTIDVISAIVITEPRKNEVSFTIPYGEDKWVMVTNLDQSEQLISTQGIIGTVSSSFITKTAQNAYPLNKFRFFSTTKEQLNALKNKKINFAVMSIANADFFLKQEYNGQFKIIPSAVDHENLSIGFAVSKNNNLLQNIINKSLLSLPAGTLNSIQNKRHTVTIKSDIDIKKIVLWSAGILSIIVTFTGLVVYSNRKLSKEIAQRIDAEQKLTYLTNNFDGVLIQHIQHSDDPFDISFLFVSEQIKPIIGISAEQLYQNPKLFFDKINQRDDREFIIDAMHTATQVGYWKTELKIMTNPTSSCWVEIRCHITKLENSWQWNSIIIDISQMKEQQLIIEQARNAANAATIAKSRFLAMMSHEIRTPISGILNLLELMEPYNKKPEVQQIHHHLTQSGTNLLNIVNDVLDFSKIEAGKLKLHQTNCNISEMIHDLIQPHAIHAVQKEIMVNLWLDPHLADIVSVDAMRLKQVLNNLLNNAIKFTTEGQVSLEIQLIEESYSQQIISFSIIDTGMGINADAIDKLFQPFEQVDQTSQRRFSGTGLGLSICYQLVELMNGTITVDSQVGKGSRFTVILTLDIVKTKQIEQLNKHCALINPINNNELKHYLSAWHCSVTRLSINNKDQLITVIPKMNIDVVIAPNTWCEKHNINQSWFELNLPSVKLITVTDSPALMLSGNARCKHHLSFNPLLPQQLCTLLKQPMLVSSESEIVSENSVLTLTRQEAIEQGRFILVAEDHPINQQILKRQLQQLNFAVDIVNNGIEALEAINNNKYNLLLTDCHMPELDGYRLIKEIRRQEQDNSSIALPVIALTANALSDQASFIKMGFSDYLIKPVARDELGATIEKWLTVAQNNQLIANQKCKHLNLTKNRQVIDLKSLEGIFGDYSTVMSILKQYKNACIDDLNQLKNAIEQRDSENIYLMSHKMKGAAQMMAFDELAKVCQIIESNANQDISDDSVLELTRYYQNMATLIDELSLQVNDLLGSTSEYTIN